MEEVAALAGAERAAAEAPVRDSHRIVWIGRVEKLKSPDFAVEAFVELLRDFDAAPRSAATTALRRVFERDFVALNCDIQQLRADNATLREEVNNGEEELAQAEREMREARRALKALEGSTR